MSSTTEHSSKSWWGKLKEALNRTKENSRPLLEKLSWGTVGATAVASKYAPFLFPSLLAISLSGLGLTYFILKNKPSSAGGGGHH